MRMAPTAVSPLHMRAHITREQERNAYHSGTITTKYHIMVSSHRDRSCSAGPERWVTWPKSSVSSPDSSHEPREPGSDVRLSCYCSALRILRPRNNSTSPWALRRRGLLPVSSYIISGAAAVSMAGRDCVQQLAITLAWLGFSGLTTDFDGRYVTSSYRPRGDVTPARRPALLLYSVHP
jgi:hypothetical protein